MRCLHLLSASVLLLLQPACKDDTVASYPTYQDCFDDLTDKKLLEIVPALVECCLDHPIDGDLNACGETMSDCVNFLTNNLSQFDTDVGQRMDACTMVEDMQDMPMM
jgi:hypothetical protein